MSMSLQPPLVSIVILSFNSRELLPRAVESVLHQDYTPIELIIVDNGSTDGTVELLSQWERGDDYPPGLARSRRAGSAGRPVVQAVSRAGSPCDGADQRRRMAR